MKVKNILIIIGIFLFCFSCKKEVKKEKIIAQPVIPKIIKEFGLTLNNYQVIKDTLVPGDSFGAIMDEHGVNRSKVFQVSTKIKDSFNVAQIASGKPYTILKSKDTLAKVKAFIYEKSKVNYTVVHLEDSIYAINKKRKIITKRKTMSGVIDSSLSQAIENVNGSPYLTHMISSIYQWSIDFFKIQKGDRFKIIYSENYLEDGTYVGVKEIECAVFEHNGVPFYAFEYSIKEENKIETSFYDEKAKSLQSFFLKAPLQFSRISSRYSPRRFHPVQKRWKAHKGTDYAAPHGTPIWSTANGTVEQVGYTSGNGRYVKIRHNKKYSTKYLHMSKTLVKQGQSVKQGQVIGKVGSTGLATGPHVCYRFWVNGREEDPFRQKLPSAKNLAEKFKPAYFKAIEPKKKELDSIQYKEQIINNEIHDISITKSNTNPSLESTTRAL